PALGCVRGGEGASRKPYGQGRCEGRAQQARNRHVALADEDPSPVYGRQQVPCRVQGETHFRCGREAGRARVEASRLIVVGWWERREVAERGVGRRSTRTVVDEKVVDARHESTLPGTGGARERARERI